MQKHLKIPVFGGYAILKFKYIKLEICILVEKIILHTDVGAYYNSLILMFTVDYYWAFHCFLLVTWTLINTIKEQNNMKNGMQIIAMVTT